MKRKIKLLLSLPKTLYFNFRAFKFRTAIHLPIIIAYNVKLGEIHKNVIQLKNWENKHYRIRFGFDGSKHIIPNRYSYLTFGKKANIIFNGNAAFAEGCALRCDYGKIIFGTNFSANRNCCFNCEYEMAIGNDVLLGWNVNFRDTDGHEIYYDNQKSINQKKVIIGNHVWICSYADILKGSKIGNDSIVAWRSCVLKKIEQDNCLIGGFPAKIIKENIEWKI